MAKIPTPQQTKYIFYKDTRIIAIIIAFIAITLQVAEFTKTPVLYTIHAYTIGILFGQYSAFFYFYCLLISITILVKPIRFLKFIQLTQWSYWLFSLSLMTALVTWFYYVNNLSLNGNSIGTGAWRQSFGLWWHNFTNLKTHSIWYPSTPDAGIIGALLYSSLAFFSTTVVTAISYSIMACLAFSVMITGTWIGLYKNILKYKKRFLSRKNNLSIISHNSPFISLDNEFDDVVNNDVDVPLPFEDVSILDSDTTSNTSAPVPNKKVWNKYNLINPLSVLKQKSTSHTQINQMQSQIDSKKHALNNLFKTFSLDAKIVDTIIGPTLTKFIIKTGSTINLRKFEQVSQNIKMVLESKEIRMELPIPGKALIGIEFANSKRSVVTFFEVFKDLRTSDSSLAVALGQTIEGKSILLNVNETPHLLIAGATGSGKSVSINTIIASLIMTKSPKDLRLLLIDPKFVELNIYENIPHLLSPIITDSARAAHDLNVIVNIMESRYKRMAELKVRQIEKYNLVAKAQNLEHWPYIVIVIDELADLMAVSAKSVETSIQRLTQKARAAGIHLILATQRPSTNVVTGVIKANIPSRIAFSVSSGVDSKVILDHVGAEKLIGQGDMLMSLYGQYIERAQGAFLSNQEIAKIVREAKKYGKPDYYPELLEHDSDEEDDHNYSFEGY